MRLRNWIGAVAFLLPSLLLAQPTGPPISGSGPTRVPPLTTVGSLPTCNAAASGRIFAVSDGASSSDCTVGSGSTVVLCYCTGSAWEQANGGLSGLGGVDNIVLRSDGTSGDTAQGSSVSLADGSGDLTAPGFTFITTEGTTTSSAGSEFTNQPANDAVEVLSSDAGDITQTVTIIGTTNGTDTVVVETIALDGTDGTTAVASTKADWGVILAVKISAITTGNITVREDSGDAAIVTITAGDLSAGVNTVVTAQSYMANRKVRLVADGATTKVVGVKGTTVLGADQYDAQALSGTTAVESNSVFGTLTEIYTGDLEAARLATAYTNADVIVDPGGSADLYLASGDITAPGALTIATDGDLDLVPTSGNSVEIHSSHAPSTGSPTLMLRQTSGTNSPMIEAWSDSYGFSLGRITFSTSGTVMLSNGLRYTGNLQENAFSNSFQASSSLVSLHRDSVFGWGSSTGSNGTDLANVDVRLYRDAAATLAQRNSTNAQKFNLYGTYTDASNYERVALSCDGSADCTLATETAGTGGDNINLILDAAGTGTVQAWGQGTYADDHVQIGPGSIANSSSDNNGSVAIGYVAYASGNKTVAIGYGASSTGNGAVSVGGGAGTAGNTNATAIGNSASADGTSATAIGSSTYADYNYSLAISGGLATTTNQAVIGGADANALSSLYFNGVADDDPNGIAINAAGGSGTNIAGASLTLAGGKGTGNAAGGAVKLQTSVAGASGTTLQTLTDVLSVKNDQATYIGDGGTTNYVKVASDGHMTFAGTATYWDDVLVPGMLLRDVGAAPADMAAWTGMSPMYAYHFEAASDEELYGSIQMPHSWAGTDIYFHVHWSPETVSDGDPANQQVRWCIDYTWAEYNTVFPAPTTATCGLGPDEEPVASKHYITAVGTLTPGTGADQGSSILYFRLYRDADHVDDDYEHEAVLLSVDAHFEANRLGSNTSTPD